MAFESADCQSNACLSRSLGYGQKHEVRDSDAADQQADGGDGAHLQRGSAVSCPSLSTIDKPSYASNASLILQNIGAHPSW
jgi:hypothetical protein